MKSSTLGSTLTAFLKRKQAYNEGYSLRAFARDLELSPSFVSRILSGEKAPAAKHLKKMFSILDIDKESQGEIQHLLLEQKIGNGISLLVDRPKKSRHLKYQKLDRKKFALLTRWYHIPVLEALTISEFQATPQQVADRLGLSRWQVEESLDLLEKNKVLKKNKNGYIRDNMQIRFATAASHEDIRKYHQLMIEKASEQLRDKSEEAFSKRLITGLTLGGSLEKLEKAKAILNEAIHQAAEILSESEKCEEVYQINLQLFPLTKKPI